MAIELKVPTVGESITEVEIGAWLKQPGQVVNKDEPVVALESEKATVELPAPESGVLTQVLKKKGEVARIGEVIGILEPGSSGSPEARTSIALERSVRFKSSPEKSKEARMPQKPA